jgi:hypothetical protein
MLIQFQVEAGLDDIQPRRSVSGPSTTIGSVDPKVDNPTPDEQAKASGQQVTAIAVPVAERTFEQRSTARSKFRLTRPHSPPPGQQTRQHHGHGSCWATVTWHIMNNVSKTFFQRC